MSKLGKEGQINEQCCLLQLKRQKKKRELKGRDAESLEMEFLE